MSLRVRSFTGPSRAALNISRKGGRERQKVAMGKERAHEGGRKKFGEVALWDVEAVLSPCQECNSHAAGIPSRSIPLAASAFVAGAIRSSPRPLPTRPAHETRETIFPPTCEPKTRRFTTTTG